MEASAEELKAAASSAANEVKNQDRDLEREYQKIKKRKGYRRYNKLVNGNYYCYNNNNITKANF
jgi:hypothetical protein